jgi:hypothetical protein
MENFNILYELVKTITTIFITTVINYFVALTKQQLICYWHMLNTFSYKFLKATTVLCLVLSLSYVLILFLTDAVYTLKNWRNVFDFFMYAVVFYFLMLSFKSDFIKAEQFRVDNQ